MSGKYEATLAEFDEIEKGIKDLKEKVRELEKNSVKTNYDKLNDTYEVLKGLRDKLVEEKQLELAGHLVHTMEVIQEEQAKIQNEEHN
jgi:hypothetical protein